MGALLGDVESERDEIVLARFRAGDLHAFEELYAAYFPRLVRFCVQRVRDPYLAEEIAQEAFVRAYQAATRLRDGSRFYPWMTVIAHHVLVDDFRRVGRVEPMAELESGIEPPADEELILQAESEALDLALSRVRARHRQVLQLRESQGLSYEDIAREIGAPVTTVPPLLHRARAALRREYLALTEQERIAAVPAWAASVIPTWRRLRDRIMQTVSSLPDMSGLATPAASVMLAVAAFMSTQASAVSLEIHHVESPVSAWSMQGEDVAARGHERSGSEDDSEQRGASGISGGSQVVGVAEISADERRSRWTQEQMREMPIYYEFGDAAIGADPDAMQRDVKSTTEGDLSWMQGRCESEGKPGC